jgi:hypothetical protein
MGKWPKFKKVSKIEPTPRTLELLVFDEYSSFDTSGSFGGIKRASLYPSK